MVTPKPKPKPKPLTLLAGVAVIGVLAAAGWMYLRLAL
jgi:hypothetical protein